MVREETTLSSEAFRSKYAVPGALLPPVPAAAPSAAAAPPGAGASSCPPSLPPPPPDGYLERRRGLGKGGVRLLARPPRHERARSGLEEADRPGWRGVLRESFRGHRSAPRQRASLPVLPQEDD